MKQKGLVIVGGGETARVVYECFSSTNHKIAGFSVERAFMVGNELLSLPVVPFEEVERIFDPDHYDAFVAISFTELNQVRARLFDAVLAKGYSVSSYISSHAFVAKSAEIGAGSLIYDNCSIGSHCKVGANTVVCSGTVIAHSSCVGRNVFVAANASIGGFAQIGNGAFIGLGSVICDRRKVTAECILSAGAVLFDDAEHPNIYKGNPAVDTGIASRYYIASVGGLK